MKYVFSKIICLLPLFTIAMAGSLYAQKTSIAPVAFDKEAHRGGRGLMPENTIPAMKNAIDLGSTTLELDLQVSKDNKVVVSHDAYFNEKISLTPEGDTLTPAEAKKRLILTMPYDSVRRYDVGLKYWVAFPRQKKIAAYKPLLGELIDSAEAYAGLKLHTNYYNMEIKSVPGGDGKIHPPVSKFVDLAINVITEHGVRKRTLIQCSDIRVLKIMHSKYKDVSTSYLVGSNQTTALTIMQQLDALGFVPTVYSPEYELVTPQLVAECHRLKMKIIPWTVNDAAEIQRLKAMEVDGIISDYPELL